MRWVVADQILQLVEPFAFQRRSNECAEILSKTGTETGLIESADVDRVDGGAIGHDHLLLRAGLGADGQQRDEQRNHSHAPQ